MALLADRVRPPRPRIVARKDVVTRPRCTLNLTSGELIMEFPKLETARISSCRSTRVVEVQNRRWEASNNSIAHTIAPTCAEIKH